MKNFIVFAILLCTNLIRSADIFNAKVEEKRKAESLVLFNDIETIDQLKKDLISYGINQKDLLPIIIDYLKVKFEKEIYITSKDFQSEVVGVSTKDNKFAISYFHNHTDVYDIMSGKIINSFEDPNGRISCICFLPNGDMAISLYDQIRIFDVATGHCLQTLPRHGDLISTLCCLPNGNLASGSNDSVIRIFNLETRKCLQFIKEHTHCIISLNLLPNGNLVSCSFDKVMKIWKLVNDQWECIKTIKHADENIEVYSICFLTNGNIAILFRNLEMEESMIKIYDFQTFDIVKEIPLIQYATNINALNDNNVAIFTPQIGVEIWDTDRGKLIKKIENSIGYSAVHQLPENTLAFVGESRFEMLKYPLCLDILKKVETEKISQAS